MELSKNLSVLSVLSCAEQLLFQNLLWLLHLKSTYCLKVFFSELFTLQTFSPERKPRKVSLESFIFFAPSLNFTELICCHLLSNSVPLWFLVACLSTRKNILWPSSWFYSFIWRTSFISASLSVEFSADSRNSFCGVYVSEYMYSWVQ